MPGSFNPKDSARATTTRPTHVDAGTSARRYFSDELGTIPAAQDLNRIIEQFYNALDYFAITDDPSNGDRMLRNLLLATMPPRYNYVGNPSFDVWQGGSSFTGTASRFIADMWACNDGAARTYSRQTGFAGTRYCCRAQRNVGESNTAGLTIIQQVSKEHAQLLAGKTVMISADMRAGANFSSSTGIFAFISTGTGVEETIVSGATFPTGSVTSGNLLGSVTLTSSVQRVTFGPYTVPADATELIVAIRALPTGTAGAADYYEATNVKLEVGSFATSFEPVSTATTWLQCLRRYCMSFRPDTMPAQNVGQNTGEERFAPNVPATSTSRKYVSFGSVPMRGVPTITLYNPAAANGQVRNFTLGVDLTSAAAGNVTERGFALTYVGTGATDETNDCGVHWLADARI